jgi:uncharacterized protein YjeT (DUF2065 family)
VKIASVAVREAMKAFVKVSPVPEILVVEAVFKVVCPETVREVAEAVVRVVCPVTPSVVVVAFVVEKRVVVASVAKKRVAVAFTKFDEVAKRLDEVELVVEALTAAKKVEVELVKIASVAVREAMKAFVKVSPVPEILVVEAVFKVVCPETVREVAEAVVRVVCPVTLNLVGTPYFGEKGQSLSEETLKQERELEEKAAKIDKYFADKNLPAAGLGKKMVLEAEKNGLPWALPAAILMAESTALKFPCPNDPENGFGSSLVASRYHLCDSDTFPKAAYDFPSSRMEAARSVFHFALGNARCRCNVSIALSHMERNLWLIYEQI